jgi:uncharacterized membrane protein YdjX (TVP38/TMEM64 family)
MGRAVWTRWLPLAVVIAAIAAALALRVDRHLTFDSLAANREWLLALVERLGFAAALLFVGVYALAVGLSVPGGTVLTILAGFLFGPLWGTLYAVVGATIGAAAIFLVARTALGDALRRRAGPIVRKLECGFRRDAFFYLLSLRLVPLVPFWLVNLVPAFFGVKLSSFVVATFLGIIPATAVYAGVGDGLGAILDAGETPDLGLVLEPRIFLPLLALAALALLPAILRRFRRGPAREGA